MTTENQPLTPASANATTNGAVPEKKPETIEDVIGPWVDRFYTDMDYAHQQMSTGVYNQHARKWIAFFNKQEVGVAEDCNELADRVGRQFGVPPESIFLLYIYG